MAGTRTAERPATQLREVVAASDMDTPTFALHFTKGHKRSLADLSELPANIPFDVEQQYRAFHTRLHGLDAGTLRHRHAPDAPEVGIDRAIESLFENNNWGWKQLAGVEGLVAVFPNGQIAVKFRHAKPRYFDEIDEATDCLLGIPSSQ